MRGDPTPCCDTKPRAGRALKEAGPAGAPRLLLVDDDESLAAMLREFLELQGFSVATVHDGEAALARVAEAPPDLVVLDVMLPGISGFEVLKRLRAHHDLPIVMLTARGDEAERIIGLLGGADDYLPKPFNPLELAARIQAVLKRFPGAEIIDVKQPEQIEPQVMSEADEESR